jgi:hypothetical protein
MTGTIQAEALFASDLQPSERPTAVQVAYAIDISLRTRGGAEGCAAVVAAEYGEHPETAALRMRWALALAGTGAAPLPAPRNAVAYLHEYDPSTGRTDRMELCRHGESRAG